MSGLVFESNSQTSKMRMQNNLSFSAGHNPGGSTPQKYICEFESQKDQRYFLNNVGKPKKLVITNLLSVRALASVPVGRKSAKKSALEAPGYYPESIAKTLNPPTVDPASQRPAVVLEDQPSYSFEPSIELKIKPVQQDWNARCSPGYMTGHSATNTFHKVVLCGKEWCPTCGRYLSYAHIRRIVRSQWRINQMGMVNYWVITLPRELRPQVDKVFLTKFRKYIILKIKRLYPNARGISRYHWAGDKTPDLFNPHLNVLIEGAGGWIDPDDLAKLRRELSIWLRSYLKLDYYPKTNLYNAYTEDVGKKKHWLNYVTRATFMGNGQNVRELISGYRNTAPFGQFDRDQPIQDELHGAMRGIDTEDGSKIIWNSDTYDKEVEHIDKDGVVTTEIIRKRKIKLSPQKTFKINVLDRSDHLGGGFFKIKCVNKPPNECDTTNNFGRSGPGHGGKK